MTKGYVYATGAAVVSGPPGDFWTNLENTWDGDWDTRGDVEMTGSTHYPCTWLVTEWSFDPIVTDRIYIKGSLHTGLNYWWGTSIRVQVDGAWITLCSGPQCDSLFPLLTFPCGTLTAVQIGLCKVMSGTRYARIYEIAVPFTSDFSATPLEGCTPLEVEFTNLSLPADPCDVQSVLWDFGDGSTSGSWSPSHTYTEKGFHTVELTVTWTPMGLVETKTDYIYVGGFIPDFEATPLTGCAPLMVRFTGSWPGPPGLVNDWDWDFGYDDLTWWGQTGLNTFCPVGTFDVKLTIDDGTCKTSITKEAYVETTSVCPTCTTYQATDEDLPWSRGASTDILGNTIVCVFTHRYPTNGVRFVRSDDRGVTWSEPVTFVNASCYAIGRRPVVRIVDSDTIYVTWGDYSTGGKYEIYFAKSLDGGETFETPVKIVDGDELPCYYNNPAFFEVDSDGRILVMWNYSSLCFASSEDGGATWINKQAVASPGSWYGGHICVDSGDSIFLICPSNTYVYLWASVDNGATWSAAHTVVHDTDIYHTARITALGTDLYAAWLMETYSVEEDEYYYHIESARSADHGVTWSSPVRVDDIPDVSDNYLCFDDGTLGIGFVGSKLAVAWLPDWGYSPPLHIKTSSDGGETWESLLKTCATWYNDSFEIAFGSDYIAAGWTGTLDTDAWPDFLYVAVCEWVTAAYTYFFLA